MGGSSKSSNHTTTTTNTTNEQVSNAFNGDQNGVVVSGIKNSNVTVTDGGAVKNALDSMSKSVNGGYDLSKYTVGKTTDLARELTKESLLIAERSTKGTMDAISTITKQNGYSTTQEVSKYFALAGVAIAVAMVWKGSK